MSINISKNGILMIDSNYHNYLVNNFSEINITTNNKGVIEATNIIEY